METPEETIKRLSEALAQEQAAREAAEAAAQEAETARYEFVSLVTHELRVPMTSIKGYTDLLLKGIMGPINEAQTNFLQIVRSNVERMSRMVADLSDINKIESHKLHLKLEAVDLAAALDEALQPYNETIEAKHQTLNRELPEDLPAILANQERLVQILSNLLSNAVTYTPEGGEITVSAAATTSAETPMVRITVADNGIGILNDEQSHVFEKFFRASDPETRQTPGNGLALHLTRLLVHAHDGQISFESEQGEGATFYITLPQAPDKVSDS